MSLDLDSLLRVPISIPTETGEETDEELLRMQPQYLLVKIDKYFPLFYM